MNNKKNIKERKIKKLHEEIKILKKALGIVFKADEEIEISTNYVEANIERVISLKQDQLDKLENKAKSKSPIY